MDGPTDKVIAAYLATFSESQRTGYDLLNVPSRGGNGLIRFTRVDFLDAEGQPTHVFRSGDRLELRITLSIGVSTFPSPRVDSAEDLFTRADAALYRAKADGRDQVRS